MAPRFTVLLPTHDRADVIGYAIRSVLAQTETSFELLVVGDGCTDATAEVVKSYDDPRVRWFDLPKGPHSGYNNRNLALAEARGDLVAYAAHDDVLAPDHLMLLGDMLDARTGTEWAYSRPLWVSPDGFILPLSGNLLNRDELDAFLTQANFIPSPCVIHRRSCFEKYGFWPEDTPRLGDWLLWRAIIEKGGGSNLAYCSVPTTFHFKAIWRESLEIGNPSVEAMSRVARRSAWWPAALRFVVEPGKPEQAALSRLTEQANWVANVRSAVLTVVERLAWDTAALMQEIEEAHALLDACTTRGQDLQHSLDAKEAEILGLQSEILRQSELLRCKDRDAVALHGQLRNIVASRSWRMTEPMRKLRMLATRLGIG